MSSTSHSGEAQTWSAPPPERHPPVQGTSFRTLRKVILVVFALALALFTSGVLLLVTRIFANFGPGVLADLEWKATRGARELAQASELGFAAGDGALIEKGFEAYRASDDVLAIVAVDPSGKVVASFGQSPEPASALFVGAPGEVRRTSGYFVGWARAEIEGATVGRLALIISTRRLVGSERLLRQIELVVGLGAALGLIVGSLFVVFFTSAIIKRDAQLADHAANLENKVEERTAQLDDRNRGMALVLDNVDQGFVTVALDGTMAAERSAIVDRWFGEAAAGESFADYLARKDPGAADWLRLGFEELVAPELPVNVILDQLPKQAKVDDRTLALRYTPIIKGGAVDRLLVVMTDVSTELKRERMERQQREMLALFQAVSVDRSGFVAFIAEASRIVATLRQPGADRAGEQRLVHTLKGNASLYRLDGITQLCHDIESRLVDEGAALTDAERFAIGDAWQRVHDAAKDLLGEKGTAMTIDAGDYAALSALVREGADREALERALRSWQLEPTSTHFNRLAEQMRQLASRLGKAPLEVRTDAGGVRLDVKRWAGFWSAFVHVARNAVDHGLDDAKTRARLGKPPVGIFWLTADLVNGEVVIGLQDDGRGIDWEKVAARATRRGLPHATRADLEAALLADGVSTKDQANLVSGRGVGMAAVKEALERMNGKVVVRSERNKGTLFEFRIEDPDAFKGTRAVPLKPPVLRADEAITVTGALPA